MPRNVDIYQRQGNELAQPYVQQGFQNAGYQSQTDQTNRANWMKDMFEEQNKLKMAAFQGGQYVDDVDAAGRAIKIWKPFDDTQKLYLRDEINKISRAMPTYTDAEGKTFYATNPIAKSAVNVNWADRQRLMQSGNEVRNMYLNQGIDPEKQMENSMKGAVDNIIQKNLNRQVINSNDYTLDKDSMLMVGNSYDQWEKNNTAFIDGALQEYAKMINQPTAQELRDYKTMLFLNTQPGFSNISNIDPQYKKHVVDIINNSLDFLDRAAYSGNAPNLFGEYLGTINQTYPATEYYKYNSMGGMKLPENNYQPWNYGEQNISPRTSETQPYPQFGPFNPYTAPYTPSNQAPAYTWPNLNNNNPNTAPIWQGYPFNQNPIYNNMPPFNNYIPYIPGINTGVVRANNNVQPNRYNWPFLNNNMA